MVSDSTEQLADYIGTQNCTMYIRKNKQTLLCRRGNKFYLLQDRRQGFHFSTFTLKAGNTFTGECFFFHNQTLISPFFPILLYISGSTKRRKAVTHDDHMSSKQRNKSKSSRGRPEEGSTRGHQELLLGGQATEKERKKEAERRGGRHMLRGYTHRYNSLQSKRRQSSSRRERTEDRR